ncbi:MAG: hypothetical protein U5Q16_02510 [Gammaproteobacteria bacterium]|nr:hypothetical protein [Gammaproteobacteria bacterium]
MPHLPVDTDALNWHRYFAMEANNRAWALAVEKRSTAQDDEMLDAAHASAWHWDACGTELNHMRARMLLAEVHALLGRGKSSLRFADEMRGYFLTHGAPDWEIAFVHSIYAHAAWVAGDKDLHRAAYQDAVAAIDQIAEPEDREVVMQTFSQVPAP